MKEDFVNFFPIVASVVGFIAAQVISYIKLRIHIDEMKKSINGIGMKVNLLANDVEEDHRNVIQRIAKIEGFVEGSYRNGWPVTHPTRE
jgi:hypothetical protein